MIEVINLTKTFTKTVKKGDSIEFNAVDGVSFTSQKGEILGIIGPNGAGKTTLLRMMGGLMHPTSGQIIVRDFEDNEIKDDVKKKQFIGYLSNNTKLYTRFTGREMLKIMGELYEIPKVEIEERIENISAALKLNDFIDNRISRLSTGQTQRMSIARCLLNNPGIYIFDEPTLGLDIISSKLIIDFMKEEKMRGKTVLYSTHYMEEAQSLCDRIMMVYEGKIIACGTPHEIMDETNTDNLRDAFLEMIETDEMVEVSI